MHRLLVVLLRPSQRIPNLPTIVALSVGIVLTSIAPLGGTLREQAAWGALAAAPLSSGAYLAGLLALFMSPRGIGWARALSAIGAVALLVTGLALLPMLEPWRILIAHGAPALLGAWVAARGLERLRAPRHP